MHNSTILEGLNDDQIKPVKDFEGPSVVLAGPGSGKTFVLVSRTAYMIESGIDPSNIILFTFTNKAAKEIKERIVQRIGPKGNKIMIGTYHSVCLRLLRKYAESIGYTNRFNIFDNEDSKNTLKPICKGHGVEIKRCIDYISAQKRRMITPEQAIRNEKGYNERFAAIYRDYQIELKKQDAMDFDDMILNMIKLLEENYNIKRAINEQYKYLIADESHDSSVVDLKLIELLTGDNQNICMIFDPDQSIYSFRGADLEAMMRIESVFPGIKSFVLHRNYRSTEAIVKAANSLISKNKVTIDKKLYSVNDQGSKIVYFEEQDQAIEANRCVKLIKLLTGEKYGLRYEDIAILYRTNNLSRSIEEAFLRNSIPYKVVGGSPFCARREIKDIMAYARTAYNQYDYESFKRSILTPKRGVGIGTVEKIRDTAREDDDNILDFLEVAKETKYRGKAKETMKDYIALIDKLKNMIEENEKPEVFIETIFTDIQYQKYLETDDLLCENLEDRVANIGELIDIASSFETIEEFLENMSLNASDIEDENGDKNNKVSLLTQHSAKGLEYEAVIVIGCSEGVSPHFKAVMNGDVEEERRLFYVAMTRAKKYLFLTRARRINNMGKPIFPRESRFIREIDKKYLTRFN